METQRVLGPLPPAIKEKARNGFRYWKRSKCRKNALYYDVRYSPSAKHQDDTEQFSDYKLEQLVDLLKKMMAWKPEDRLTAEEALNHAFFDDYDEMDSPAFDGTMIPVFAAVLAAS